MDPARQEPRITVEPPEIVACPGDTVAIAWSADGLPETSQWRVTCDHEGLGADVAHDVGPRRGRGTIAVPESGAAGRHVVRVSAVLADGSIAATGTAALDVTDRVRLVPSSLDVDGSGLSWTVSIRSCSEVTPQLTVELRCEDGSIVVKPSVQAQVPVAGVGHLTLTLVDVPDVGRLGSCRVRLVDEAGGVLDERSVEELRRGPRGRLSPVRRLLRVLVPAVAVVTVGLTVFLMGRSDGPAIAQVSCDVDGSSATCTAEISGFGEDPVYRWSAPAARTTGGTDTATMTATFPTSPDAAAHDVELEVCDPTGSTCRVAGARVEIAPALPDLVVSDEIRLEGDPGGCVVFVTVTNDGAGRADATLVSVTSTGSVGEFSARTGVPPLGAREAASLEAFVSRAVFCQFDPDSSGVVVVDPDDTVRESEETNNVTEWLVRG